MTLVHSLSVSLLMLVSFVLHILKIFFFWPTQKMADIHMQWETVMEIFIYIGKQLTTHLDSKEALFGIGLIRRVVFEIL